MTLVTEFLMFERDRRMVVSVEITRERCVVETRDTYTKNDLYAVMYGVTDRVPVEREIVLSKE